MKIYKVIYDKTILGTFSNLPYAFCFIKGFEREHPQLDLNLTLVSEEGSLK